MNEETLQEYWLARKHLVDAAIAGKHFKCRGALLPDKPADFSFSPDDYEIVEPKLSIPWTFIDDKYQWAAMDEDRQVKLFIFEPAISRNSIGGYWRTSTGDFYFLPRPFKQPKGIDWRHSKIQRPIWP